MLETLAQDVSALVHDWNATDDSTTLGHCLHHLIEKAADQYPTNVALHCNGVELRYRELSTAANRLARALRKRHVGRGDIVLVALDRSVDLVVALLAVLKAGAAYLPIDPAFPQERIQTIIGDARPKLLVTDGQLDRWAPWRDICQSVGAARDTSLDASNLGVDVGPDDTAYVICTSGSTGKPKGVQMSHGAISNALCSLRQEPGCGPADKWLAVSAVAFDMAVPELFLVLMCGATVVIAQTHEARDPAALFHLMGRHSITIMQATPATWQLLLDAGWQGEPRLTKLLCGGELFTRRLADRLLGCSESVWNVYGPAETSYTTVGRVRDDGNDIDLGRPVANGRVYVLGNDMKPVPLGSPGEIYVGGGTVAQGYLNNPDLTKSRFSRNPFHQGIIYRTGDLGQFVAPGKLQVIGRADDQIKIRGHRIEPGDVEAVLCSHGDVSAAAVVSRDDRLVAYVKVSTGLATVPSAVDRVLRPWTAERLPAYMVPAFFIALDVFPATSNGKVDRKALPDPMALLAPLVEAEPATELQRQIVAVWASVLGHDRIGLADNFFQVGGDSARVVRVQSGLQKALKRTVPLAKLFEHFTVEALAAYLSTDSDDDVRTRGQEAAENGNFSPPPLSRQQEDIAIVSMACRLPGGVSSPQSFWELLVDGRDAIIDVPKSRWDAETLFHENADVRGKTYCNRGGFLQDVDLDAFDASLFGISPREARMLDPLQRLALETCWEAFERAGYVRDQLKASSTGVFMGVSSNIGSACEAPALEELDGYAITGSANATLSGRVSYTFGLEGPALTVDTACSSSLVSTHIACASLRQGDCDMAVAGGITLMVSPAIHVEFSLLKAMSPDGRCRAFSEDTQGTGWGEGAAVVVLKRLSDAQRDGDFIHAVIRGTAVNHDGRSAGLTIPSGPAQERLLRKALGASGNLQPNQIDYIEAHGTGTRLGDPIEAAALATVFGPARSDGTKPPLLVGSAKTNIGHTQAAAGLAGVLKVILSLQNEMLPKTLHASEPTSLVDWKGANMALVQQQQPWPSCRDSSESRLRRAGVSSFGIGGTNAHVVVEEAPRSMELSGSERRSMLPSFDIPFVFSGHTRPALTQQLERFRRYLLRCKRTSQDLEDISYSLALTRNHFKYRKLFWAKDQAGLLAQLESAVASPLPSHISAVAPAGSSSPYLAMLFTGQGSIYPRMGHVLSQTYPVFCEALEEITGYFDALPTPLLDVMRASADDPKAALLRRTDFAQPALFALEVALYRLWTSWGVAPLAVLGHSVGEFAAAHVAGIFALPEACRIVAARSRLMQALSCAGSMVSLEASALDVAEAVEMLGIQAGTVAIAGYNTPTQTVISGDVASTEALATHMKRQGRKVKVLDVSHAFHSHHMDGMLESFRAELNTVVFSSSPPAFPIVSSMTGKLARRGEMQQPDYWVTQARQAVRFSDGIQALADGGANVFLEIGPRPALSGLGASCLAESDTGKRKPAATWVPSLVPGKDDVAVMQASLAQLHVGQVPLAWSRYFAPYGCRRVELPTYAFQNTLSAGDGTANQETNTHRSAWANRASNKRSANGQSKPTSHCASTIGNHDLANGHGNGHGDVPPGTSREEDRKLNPTIETPSATLPTHKSDMLNIVREVAADVLGMASPDDMDVDTALQDIGIDSLTAVLLRNRLVEKTGLNLKPTIATAYPNLRALSTFIANQLTVESDTDTSDGETDSPADDLVSNTIISVSRYPPNRREESVGGKRGATLDSDSRILCPPLDLVPTKSSPDMFYSTLNYFSRFPQCSRLLYDYSPVSGLLPGYGQAVPFISTSFNPRSPEHDQFVAGLRCACDNHVASGGTRAKATLPALRHMLCLFRFADVAHRGDGSRPVGRVTTLFALGDRTSGYRGLVAGGLIALLFDEAFCALLDVNAALLDEGPRTAFAGAAVTASLNVEYLAPVPTSEAIVCVTAWIVATEGRRSVLKAEMTTLEGQTLTASEAVFVNVKAM